MTASKKKKTARATRSSTRSPTGLSKQVLMKRISRQSSQQSRSRDDRRWGAPIFYQPSQSPSPNRLASSSKNPNHTAARAPRVQDHKDQEDNEGSDEELDPKAVVDALLKLPTDQRYMSISKMFALKLWPWVSPNWWLGEEQVTKVPRGSTRMSSAEKKVLERKKLEEKNRWEFKTFMLIDMDISSEEWMTAQFRSNVSERSTFNHLYVVM